MSRADSISNVLSINDTGENGSHQAGMHIPKNDKILSFFPALTKDEKNPRNSLTFTDSFKDKWIFNFIYYNNRFFGGTRNEYRLTGMTKFFKAHNLKAGDTLTLHRDIYGFYTVEYEQNEVLTQTENQVLRLGNTWKVVRI
ncbi:MAG: EcoRII N-terminal effector-binding domain-containing protein [Candidatus Latescibacterota bacterium]|nr:EcoRII N-terminal effector-binding domain-containing protein [Candidatus Latescibacterota bacterium]